jgi:Mn2+/Fe2+ NRAMP family transporter
MAIAFTPKSDRPIFYRTFLAVTATAAILVMIPGTPLIPILFLTQALNAVMLLPLLAMIIHLCRDQKMMGTLKIGRAATALSWTTFAMIAAAIAALGAYSLP